MSVAAISPAVALDHAATTHRKLVDAAQQFEGIFLGELLKPMAKASAAPGDGDDDQQDPDTMQSLGLQSLARSLAATGGFGIAGQVVKDVEARAGETAAAKNSETGLKVSGEAPI